jgi:hypothetical protein
MRDTGVHASASRGTGRNLSATGCLIPERHLPTAPNVLHWTDRGRQESYLLGLPVHWPPSRLRPFGLQRSPNGSNGKNSRRETKGHLPVCVASLCVGLEWPRTRFVMGVLTIGMAGG